MAAPTPIRGLGPDSRLGDAARRILAGRLGDVRAHEPSLEDGLDEDTVHDMRVATRRLRAALQVFSLVENLKKLERDVKRLQDALGGVRDLHVQAGWLAEAAKKEKDSVRRDIATLRKARLEGLKDAEARLRAEVQRWSERTEPRLLRKLGGLKDAHRFGSRRVRGHLRERVRRLHKRMRRYADAPDAASAHNMRKELKKLRYELEIFQPAFRRTMDALLEVLVPLQDSLGELHDADVRLELLERLAAEASPKQAKAARTLLPRVRDERAQRAAEIARELQRWGAERIPQRLRRMLA